MSNYIVVEDEFGNILEKVPVPIGTSTIPVNIKRYGDPYWDEVILAMHMDGNFIDEKEHIATEIGTVSTNGNDSLFVGSASYYSGGDGYLIVTPVTDFQIESKMTYELFVYAFNLVDPRQILQVGNYALAGNGGISLIYYDNRFRANVNGIQMITEPDFLSNTWYHIAIVLDGNIGKLFIDGVLQKTITTITTHPVIDRVTIGSALGLGQQTYTMAGRIADVRITRGIARYTEDFDIPTTPFLSFGLKNAWNGRAKVYTTGAYNDCSGDSSVLYKIHNITITNNSVIIPPIIDPENPYVPPPYVPPILPPYVPPVVPPPEALTGCPLIINSHYSASPGDVICFDTSGGAINVTIPETAQPGDTIILKDYNYTLAAPRYLKIISGPLAKHSGWLFTDYYRDGFEYEYNGLWLKIEYISDAYGWELAMRSLQPSDGVPPKVEVPVEPIVAWVPPTDSDTWPVMNDSFSTYFGDKRQVNVGHDITITLPLGMSGQPDIYIKSSLVTGSGGKIYYNTGVKPIGGSTHASKLGPWGPGFNHRLVWVSDTYGWDIWQS